MAYRLIYIPEVAPRVRCLRDLSGTNFFRPSLQTFYGAGPIVATMARCAIPRGVRSRALSHSRWGSTGRLDSKVSGDFLVLRQIQFLLLAV